MIDRELDLIHVWGNLIGFTPIIGSLYAGRPSGLSRLMRRRDITDELPDHASVWIHLDDVGPLSAQSEPRRDPLVIDVDAPRPDRNHLAKATLEIPPENVHAFIDAISRAAILIHKMGAGRPREFGLLRNSQTERYIVINAQRADETPLPPQCAERLHTPLP